MWNCFRLCLVGLSLVSFASGYVYQCELGTDPTVCSVWNFQYGQSNNSLPSVNIPPGVRKVRLSIEQYYYERQLNVRLYDAVLHETILHSPTAVQVIYNRVAVLHMPTNLQVGEFQHNSISQVLVNASESYALTYLDLLMNSLEDISNLTALVHLQTLNLESNGISQLNSSIFSGMHNLSMLYLGANSILKVDLRLFPKGLTHVSLLRNDLTELSFTGVSLPAVTVLDVENNGLTTIDLAGLFTACPALRVLPIALNLMQEHEAKRIIAELGRHNVSHYFGHSEVYCSSDEYEVSNICFPGSVLLGRSLWKALVLLMFAVVLVAVFVSSVRWIWYQMRY